MMSEKRIALFGGTFDPIHLGHTTVASAACESIGADKVIFVPARRSPLKAFFPEASDEDRLTMIELATAENKMFGFSNYEVKKAGPSYTLETVRYFRQQSGNDVSIYWLIGTDTLDDLPHWYGITELIDECNLAVMHRAGFAPPDFSKFVSLWGEMRVKKMQQNVVETPLVDISSTEVRKRLAAGREVSGMISPKVLQYIRVHSLYGYGGDV
jgi:nicotinate-nucleotide adenylyltransferase